MSFLRRPAWVGALNQPEASSGGFTPRESWTLVNLFNFEDGGADGTAYTSPVANVVCDGDYGFDGRIWVDAGGVLGKSLRFGRQTEIGGSNNSRYRGYMIANATYLTTNNMMSEGRITMDVFLPTNPTYRGMGGADPQVWFWCGVWSATRFIIVGFDANETTLGVWNLPSANFTGIPSAASRDIGASAAPGWHTLDFRYKLDATTGYAWIKWDSLDPIYYFDADTGFTPTNSFGASCGSPINSNNDLTYFGAFDNLRFYQPA